MLLALAACAGEAEDAPPDAGAVDVGARQCPTHLRFTFLAGNRTDVGWTGNLHGSTFARDSFFRVRVVECDDDCRLCAFEGPVRDATVVTERCVSDPAQVCASDADCPPWECRRLDATNPQSPRVCAQDSRRPCTRAEDCGPSACRFFIGPAFPILAPRTCLGVYFDSLDARPPVLGTIDLFTGAVQLERMRIVSGATDSENQGACPKCVGDRVPNDGQREGRCVQSDVQPAFPYGANQTCDANGVGQPRVFDGNYSLDCSTPLGVRIALGLEDGSTNGRRFQIGAGQPSCGGEPCWCGVCEGTLEACHDASDCRGVACVAPTDLPVRANACIEPCAWDPATQRGTCLTQDPPSSPDAGLPPPRRTSCFPSGLGAEIVAPGRTAVLSSESYSVEIGHVACRAPVRAVVPGPVSIAADRQIGLPGPQLDVLRFQIDKEYAP